MVIAEPALKTTGSTTPRLFLSRMKLTLYCGLTISVGSGIVWLFLLAARITNRPLSDVFADDTVWVVLTDTRFGLIWLSRMVWVLLIGGLFAAVNWRPSRRHSIFPTMSATALSLLFLAELAWVGHSGALPGAQGYILLGADALHLIAAGAWLGALAPLALLFQEKIQSTENLSQVAVYFVTRRFSDFALVAVATLVVSGLINTWFLVGSLNGIVSTGYGRLVLTKIALFTAMIAFAATNRQYLVPRLHEACDGPLNSKSLRELLRNTLVEIYLGLCVLMVVGALGIIAPTSHGGMQAH